MRYLDGLGARMRVVSEDAVYDVQSVADPDGRGRELVLLATRKAD
jgi:hypothetical protein